MSIIRAMREESETIKFDNLFTNDLEKEQEFDLIFTAEQDDEDLKSVAGNAIMKEDGNEIETNLPDCVVVYEDGEVVDKDEEAEAESDEPVEDIGTAEVEEPVEEEKPEAPGIVVNIDADDVNINAASEEKVAESDEGNVGMTINATTVNMSVAAGDIENEKKEEEEEVPPTVEPAAPEVPSEPEEAPAPAEEVPAEEPEEAEIVATIDTDETFEDDDTPETATDDDAEPTATAENASDIYTPSQMEEILNTGTEPDPIPQVTTPENEPVDPSTEVVFSDTGDQEVQEAAEPTKDPIKPIEEDALFEEDVIDVQDAKPIDAKDIEKNTDVSPIGPDEVIPDEVNVPAEDQDYEKEAEMKHEAAEPTKDPIKPIEEEVNFDDDLENNVGDNDKVQSTMDKAPEDEVKKELDIEPVKPEDIPGSKDNLKEASEDMDPMESIVQQDAEDSLLGIEPSLTAGDLPQMYIEKDDDPSKVDDGKLAEAAEPTKDPIKPIEEDAVFEEVIDAVKNDMTLEPAKKIEAEYEDDMKEITDGDVEKVLNKAPEDEVKEELKIDPVKPEDIPMNDGSVKEAAEPTKDPIKPIEEDVNFNEECEECDPTEGAPAENGLDAPMSDDPKHRDTSALSAIAGKNTDEVQDAAETVEDLEISTASVEEAAEPTKDPITPIKEEPDFMDQVNAEDNGDNFADVMNTGLNTTPEEVEPGSIDELIDDEVCEFVESL